MAGKGGYRPGAGRPKAAHTVQAEALKAYLIKKVIEQREPLISALIAKALTGDVPALKEILERTLGKVTEKHELTGKDGQPIPILAKLDVPTNHRHQEDSPAPETP